MEFVQSWWTTDVQAVVRCGINAWYSKAPVMSLQSWIGVGLYYLAGSLAFLTWRRQESVPYRFGRLHRKFWLLAALTFFLLGLNKQFDLLDLVTATARCQILFGGHYFERREYQRDLIAFAVAAFGALFAMAAVRFRKLWPYAGLAMMSVSLVWIYTAVRMISLHQVDAVLGKRLSGVSINAMIEVAIIFMVIGNALRLLSVPARRATALAESASENIY
jgi:hypothetical protein